MYLQSQHLANVTVESTEKLVTMSLFHQLVFFSASWLICQTKIYKSHF